jgi:hypothetical protein
MNRELFSRTGLRRASGRLRRSTVKALGVDLDAVVHLDSHYAAPVTWADRLALHSPACTVEFAHPRDPELVTHAFGARWIYRLESCIWDPQGDLAFTLDHRLIAESTSWPPLHALTSWPVKPRHAPLLQLDGDCIIMPTTGYGHWLLEDLPCVLAALRHAPHATMVVSAQAPGYVRAFLRTLPNRVVDVEGPVTLARVVMVGRGPDTGWTHPVDAQSIATMFGSLAPGDRAVYGTRSGGRRAPANEALVEAACRELGVEVVSTATMPLDEQARLFAGARLVVVPHGAGLANIVWMQPGARVIELFAADYVVPCYAELAAVRGLQYSCLISATPGDSSVDLDALRRRIAAA